MQQPVAEIVRLSGHTATVAVDAGIACARCAAGKGCGAALLAGDPGVRHFEVAVPEGLELASGDRVRLTLAPRHLLEASLAVYGWPLLALVAVPAVANMLWGPLSDGLLLVLAALAVGGTLYRTRRRLARDPCLERFVPSIAGREPRANAVDD